MMTFNSRWIGRAAAAALLFAPAMGHAQALNPSFLLDANFDAKGSNFYGAGMHAPLPGSGAFSPYVDLYGYHFNFPAGTDRGSIYALNPAVGFSHSSGRSSVNAGIGYAVVSKTSPTPVLNTERGGKSGVTASFGAQALGPGERPYKAEFLGDYNFGSDYLWTRARASVPFSNSVAHPSRIGLEIIGQGANENHVNSHSFAFGPTFETKLSRELDFTISAGPKFDSHGASSPYLRLALGITP